MKTILIWATFVLIGSNLIAQNITTDRPDQTESSSVIPEKSIQIESGLLIEEIGKNGEKSLYFPSSLLRIGLTKYLEIRVMQQLEHRIYNTNNIIGFNDIELGVKIQIIKNEMRSTEIAILSHVGIPNSSNFFTNNTIGLVNKICISHATKNRINIGYNIGYNHFKDNRGNITYSLAAGFEINEKINTYIEPYGQVIELENWESSINIGVTYLLKNNIQLDYCIGAGINHMLNFTSIGCSVQIK